MLCTLVATNGVRDAGVTSERIKVGRKGDGLGTEALELSGFSSLAARKMSAEKAAPFGSAAPEPGKYQVS